MPGIDNLSSASLQYRRFTEMQLDQLHQATLEILEDIGIYFHEPEALEIFRKGGAIVEDDLIRIPSALVDHALSTVPKSLTLYDQTDQPTIHLVGRCAYFGNGSDLLYIIDHRDNERRLAKLQDVVDIVQLLDALKHIDFVMSGFLPRDVPIEKAELLQMKIMLQHTDKPIVYVVTDLSFAQLVVEMAEVVAGGAEALRERPFAACYINITNPLFHNPESIQKLIWLSRKGLPFVYRPALVTRGVSTPLTGAGFLAVQNAAGLSGLVLSQLVHEGTPFIRDACAGGTFDMQYMVGLQSPPEIRGFNEEMLHYYGLPGFGIGGNTGSKAVDGQAAIEAALSLLTSVQAGAHLIHDMGYMDNGTTGSLEQLVICDEIIGWIKAYSKPLEINDETLALDSVREVVAKKSDFLGSENTLKHFREDYYSQLFDRQQYHGWKQSGSSTLRKRANNYVEMVLSESPKETLSGKQSQKIQAIIERA